MCDKIKILFVNPSNERLYDTPKERPILEPLWAEYLKAVLSNYDVKIFDMNVNGVYFPRDLSSFLHLFKPDVVGVSVATPLVKESQEIIRLVRGIYPLTKIIVGGPHISALRNKDVLRELGADFGVAGEGEYLIESLINEKKRNEPFLWPVDSNPSISKNLNSLPFPSRLPRKDYHLNYDFGVRKQVLASVMTSRSCPYQCTFCASKCIFGDRTRMRSAENVVKELNELKQEFGVNSILFLDDCFTLLPRRVEEICKLMIRESLDIGWWIDTRCDNVNEEMLKLMKKAGLKFVVYGVESGSARILRRIRKNIPIEQVKKAFRITHKIGIDTKANFILGHLGETERDMMESINLAKELKATRTSFYKMIPLPGSLLYTKVLKRGLIKGKKFEDFAWYGNPPNISNIPTKDLNKIHREAVLMFNPETGGAKHA